MSEVFENDHYQYFQYNIFLPDSLWYRLVEGRYYWLRISAYISDDNLQLGWISSEDEFNEGAVCRINRYSILQHWMHVNNQSLNPGYPYIPGDVNDDGIVNNDDLDYWVSWTTIPGHPPPPYVIPGTEFYAALDVNGDCLLLGSDLIHFINYFRGYVSSLNYCLDYPPMDSVVSLDLSFVINGDQEPWPFCDYLPGDVNMANGLWPPAVIGSDVTYLVNYFKGSPSSQPCLLEGFWCSGDANGDCIIMGSDVTRLVGYFRGNDEIEFCADYPPTWPTSNDIPNDAPDGWPNCE